MNIFIKIPPVFLFLTALLLLPSCIQKKPDLSHGLSRLQNFYKPDFEEEQDNIYVKVKKLTDSECSDILGVNPIKYGIQPIIIFIKNDSNNIIYFTPECTGLHLIAPHEVSKRCHWKNLEISGLSSYLAILYQWELLIPIAYCSYYMRDKNTKITQSISEHAINSWDAIKILPLETLNKIMFVEILNSPSSFKICIFNKDKKESLNFYAKLK
jgi:hypothetical protein